LSVKRKVRFGGGVWVLGARSAPSVPFKVGSRKVYNYSTRKEIASKRGPPRPPRQLAGQARRPVCIEFSGQKRVGDFERRKEKFLIPNPRTL